jgi:hypothetical protein
MKEVLYFEPVGNGISYHRFPKDPIIRKKWIDACMRKDSFNPDSSCVCSNHFVDEDYDRDLRNELLGLPQKRKLKKEAVPSQNLG